MSNELELDVTLHLDLGLLREQKQAVLDACDQGDSRDDLLMGVLQLLDHVQDCAAVEVGEEAVFGPKCKFCGGYSLSEFVHQNQPVCDACWDDRLHATN